METAWDEWRSDCRVFFSVCPAWCRTPFTHSLTGAGHSGATDEAVMIFSVMAFSFLIAF
jgi:hypothetical protein